MSPLSMVYPQDEALSEAIVVPFHEITLAREFPLALTTSEHTRADYANNWADTRVDFHALESGAWVEVELPLDVPLAGFDTLELAARLPADLTVGLVARVDASAFPEYGANLPNAAEGKTTAGERFHLRARLAGDRLCGIRIRVTAHEAGRHGLALCWVRLVAADLRSQIESRSWHVDRAWPMAVKPDAEWGDIAFRRGLLFDANDLPRLRQKCLEGDWRPRFEAVLKVAQDALKRDPEADLGPYLPWSDRRFSVPRHPHRPFFHECLDVGFAGLILDDRAMLRHAARYLMCMVHTRHWCQSEESRTIGLKWDQRCFLEEMATTAVSLLADWLDFALTDAGKGLVDQSIWDKGLTFIERDLMKFPYLHRNNQGPWFGRARIFGALMLETSWPHVGDYADRAQKMMVEDLGRYILDDGGTDEGIGYLNMTVHTAFAGLWAYARARSITVRQMLPEPFERLERYVAVMSASKPGRTLLVGDNSKDKLRGDAVAILASVYPGQAYDKLIAAQLVPEEDTYYQQYMNEGVFGLILGPEKLAEPRCVVPQFDLLERTGHATSFRGDFAGRSLRLHVSGCRAAPSHTHLDQGALTVECDTEPMLVDRGALRYDDTRSIAVKYSSRHNVLTPVRADGSMPDQNLPLDQAVVPEATGDAERFEATVDLRAVWKDQAESIQRHVVSESLDAWAVTDRGRWQEAVAMVQHWQALSPFTITDDGAELAHAGIKLAIRAPWAVEIRQAEDSIDFAYRPVYHLQLVAPASRDFELTTRFQRID